ncbi:MAG: helix-turn-helix domain-containing protein, partial [Spirochaetia bacterium]
YRLQDDERIKDPTTIAVYAAITSFIDYRTGVCWAGHRKIGRRARCNEDTVQRHIGLLIRRGYLWKESGKATGESNTYHLNDPWGKVGGTAPVRQGYRMGAVPGSAPVGEGYLMDAAGGTAPVGDERYPLNETEEQEKKRDLHEVRTSVVPRASRVSATSVPLSLRSPMTQKVRKTGIDRSFMDSEAWWNGILELIKKHGASEKVILENWQICLSTRPDKARFFPRDYSRYAEQRMELQRKELKAAHPDDGKVSPEVEQAMARALEARPSAEEHESLLKTVEGMKTSAIRKRRARAEPGDPFIAVADEVIERRESEGTD